MKNGTKHRDNLCKMLNHWGSGPDVMISNTAGTVVVTRSRFKAFKGEGQSQPYSVLAMCMDGGGRTRKQNKEILLDDVWRPGRVGLALPGPSAEGFSPAMDMLAIAFDMDDVPACHGKKISGDDLKNAAARLFDDDLASAVMIAMLRDAEAHGTSSVFFDHGLSLILHRLSECAQEIPSANTSLVIARGGLAEVMRLMEERLDEDLRIKDLAFIAGTDPRTLTRQFKNKTGYTPYMFLTRIRMQRAKELLQSGVTVTETATAVSYANPAKFAAAFRRWTGNCPSGWKKENT